MAGIYRIGLADPAWRFNTRTKAGEGRSPQAHYKTMTIEEICALGPFVRDLMAPDSVMLMWNVWPLMMEWPRVITAWGYRYSGLAWEWIKWSPATGKYSFGGGFGTRKNVEPCLLLTRGRGVPVLHHDVNDRLIFAARREHSRKPDEQYQRIERLFGSHLPRVELFARQRRPGWHQELSNQADKFSARAA